MQVMQRIESLISYNVRCAHAAYFAYLLLLCPWRPNHSAPNPTDLIISSTRSFNPVLILAVCFICAFLQNTIDVLTRQSTFLFSALTDALAAGDGLFLVAQCMVTKYLFLFPVSDLFALCGDGGWKIF